MPDTSRFLQGSFTPVTEETTAFDLPVTGTLPAELTGRYLRNGPNPLGLDDPNYHWFLGAGMVHGVRIRHDLTRGVTQAREFGRDATVGEAVFAPSSPDSGEDDGYVMAFVHNPDRGASDLVILSAQDFLGEPVATVHLPARVPLGFHGSWIADR